MSRLTNFKVFDIDWDIEDDEFTYNSKDLGLPLVFILSLYLDEFDDVEDILASTLSDEFGFCVNDFQYEEISNED